MQAAYGIIAEVDQHPVDLDTILFMDWRDDHFDSLPDMKADNECALLPLQQAVLSGRHDFPAWGLRLQQWMSE